MKAKLESAYSFMLKYSEITGCTVMAIFLGTLQTDQLGKWLTSRFVVLITKIVGSQGSDLV